MKKKWFYLLGVCAVTVLSLSVVSCDPDDIIDDIDDDKVACICESDYIDDTEWTKSQLKNLGLKNCKELQDELNDGLEDEPFRCYSKK